MTVRSHIMLLILIAGLGAIALVGVLARSYSLLEAEQVAQELSAKAQNDLKYAKEDLRRLATTGDLVFGSTEGVNSYLAQPAQAQIKQIGARLKKISREISLDSAHYQRLQGALGELKELFSDIHKGKKPAPTEEPLYDRYERGSGEAIRAFRKIFKVSKRQAKMDREQLSQQKQSLRDLALGLSALYLSLILLLTWWGARAIAKPVSVLSDAARASLDLGSSFKEQRSGPLELQALGKVLFRLINQLEGEVAKKTQDLAEENRVRRLAEIELRELNLRQQELVEASVRFVPRPFLEFLGRSDLTLVQRGDSTRQTLGILFSDLRGFTSLAEGRSPEEIFDLLNRYLDAVVPAIHKHGGFVDKYIGDAIMALFPQSPSQSVRSAIEMFQLLYGFVDHSEVMLKMGVGLHWGEVVLGTLGSRERWESTVIGDSVNLAARLEGMTKAYECPLIISGSVVELLDEDHEFNLRILDFVRVKGRSTPVKIYEVIDAHVENEQAARLSNLAEVERGVELYRLGQIEAASMAFREAKKINAEDPLPSIYLDRCAELIQEGITEEWSGVYNHTTK